MSFTNVTERMRGLGFDVISDIRKDLFERGKIATGTLARDTKFELISRPSLITLNFKAPSYWVNVDEGRKAGSKMPPERAINRWLRQKGIDLKLSFIIRRAIGEKGIPATNIYTNAIENAKKQFVSRAIEAMTKDLTNQTRTTLQTR